MEDRYLPYIIIPLIILAFIVSAYIINRCYSSPLKRWNRIYDNCNEFTANHTYIVRLYYKKYRPSEEFSQIAMNIELLDKDEVSLLRFNVMPHVMASEVERSTIEDRKISQHKCIHFLVRVKTPLRFIQQVVLNHNGFGKLELISFEIQNINSDKANIAYPNTEIILLPPEKAPIVQSFPAATQKFRPIEESLRPKVTLEPMDYLIYFYFVIGLITLLSIYLIFCVKGICKDYRGGYTSVGLTALFIGFVSVLVFTLLCFFHRYVINKYIESKFCLLFRYVFLFLVIILGFSMQIVSMVMAAENRTFPEDNRSLSSHEILWLLTAGLSGVIFSGFLVGIVVPFAYCIGFFNDPRKKAVPDKTVKTSKKSPPSPPPKSLPKVKRSTNKASKETTKGVKRKSSPESNGSRYYQQLMAGRKKVTSISKY